MVSIAIISTLDVVIEPFHLSPYFYIFYLCENSYVPYHHKHVQQDHKSV